MNQAYETLVSMAKRFKTDPNVCCLLGLGSMSELSRMDQYSDMDFFLIVEDGFKETYIKDLSWFGKEIVFSFQNTKDGYKVLFADGVFAEFAVFIQSEMPHIGFTKGKVYYAKPGFDLSIVEPKQLKPKKPLNVDFNINEALTNLYVGVLREKRGEHASSFTFIQVYAADLIMRLFEDLFVAADTLDDYYVFERRIEFKYQESKKILSGLKQGYDKNLESALFALEFLNLYYSVNQAMVIRIKSLI